MEQGRDGRGGRIRLIEDEEILINKQQLKGEKK
jgi:hypothetical protein